MHFKNLYLQRLKIKTFKNIILLSKVKYILENLRLFNSIAVFKMYRILTLNVLTLQHSGHFKLNNPLNMGF